MALTPPTNDDLAEIASRYRLGLGSADIESFREIITGALASYDAVERLYEASRPEPPDRPYRWPDAAGNELGAWYVTTELTTAPGGPLAGRRVAIKDNIEVAGLPMMNGSATVEGFIPRRDATVVTRLLDAGATIAGKAVCEDLCFSGGSHTSRTGPVLNPWDRGRSAGGSSSGSAALVAAGHADMALGGDQGGSVRIPSAYCGTVGHKPTHGLVPYTGIMPIEIYIDHTGPITRNVSDNALLLEVLAGPDGYDPRQYDVKVHPYASMLNGGVKGMRIGVVTEGFQQANAEADVSAKVRDAAARLARLGAEVAEISIPMHLTGPALWMPIGVEGLTQTMMWGDGYGVSRPDLYVTSLMDFHRGWRRRANEMSETTKLFTMFGTYIRKYYGSRYYGKAMNITRRLTAAYDAALATHDLLLMPTTPIKATALPPADAPRELYVERALNMISNTAPFDISHHPAMALPCGMSDGLPVSVMLIGKHFDEPTIYRAAYAFEQSGDWTKL